MNRTPSTWTRDMDALKILEECLREADGDTHAGLLACEYILSHHAGEDGPSVSEPYPNYGTKFKRESEWTDENYPRNNSNQFLEKESIVCAAQSPAELDTLLKSIPEKERLKLERAVVLLQGGGTINHPRENPNLGINVHGQIPDRQWAHYQMQTDEYQRWCERDEARKERTKLADKALRSVRSKEFDHSEVDSLLKEAGARPAELRSLSRAAHRRDKVGNYISEDGLHDIYEEVIESVYRRIENEAEDDPEQTEPEEPRENSAAGMLPLAAMMSHDPSEPDDRPQRVALIADILAILFDQHAPQVARQLYLKEHPEHPVALSLDELGIWHGPVPPSPDGWVQIEPGPHGGMRWAQSGSGGSRADTTPTPRQGGAPPQAPGQQSPAQPQTQYAQRHAAAVSAHNAIMAKLRAGHQLQHHDRTAIAPHLAVMTLPQLRELHAALGGTGALTGSRVEHARAVRAVLAGSPVPTTQPTTPTPRPSAQATPTTAATPPPLATAPTPRPNAQAPAAPAQRPPQTPAPVAQRPPSPPVTAATPPSPNLVDKIHSVLKSNPTPEQMGLMIDKIRGLNAQDAQELQNRLKPKPKEVSHTSQPPKLPEGIRLHYTRGEQDEEKIKQLVGRKLSEAEIGAIACAPNGATVDITVEGRSVYIGVNHEGVTTQRGLHKDSSGNLYCKNGLFVVDDDSPSKGKGADILLNQVRQLRAIGAKYMKTSAAGSGRDQQRYREAMERWERNGRPPGSKPYKPMNGYITWPKLGYSGKIDDSQFRELPEDIQRQMGSNREIRDLMEIPGGADAWEKSGSWIDLKFDLTDGSRNLKAMDKYLNERAQRPRRNRAA